MDAVNAGVVPPSIPFSLAPFYSFQLGTLFVYFYLQPLAIEYRHVRVARGYVEEDYGSYCTREPKPKSDMFKETCLKAEYTARLTALETAMENLHKSLSNSANLALGTVLSWTTIGIASIVIAGVAIAGSIVVPLARRVNRTRLQGVRDAYHQKLAGLGARFGAIPTVPYHTTKDEGEPEEAEDEDYESIREEPLPGEN